MRSNVRTPFALAAFFLFLFLVFSNASAAEWAPEGTRERKFQRGLINTFLSPIEFSHALQEVEAKDTLTPSWFWGGMKGLIDTGIRATTGVYEIITAPIPSPPDYRPIYRPELVLGHLPPPSKDSSGETKKH